MPETAGPEHRSIKAVIFDMDNTLFDFVEAKLIACAAVIAYVKVPVEPVVLLNYFLRPIHGFESHENIRDFLHDNNCYSESAFTQCCAIYDEEKIAAIKPYPHVAETLSALRERGLKLGVVTDAHNGNALKRLKKAGLEEFFDAVITKDMSAFPQCRECFNYVRIGFDRGDLLFIIDCTAPGECIFGISVIIVEKVPDVFMALKAVNRPEEIFEQNNGFNRYLHVGNDSSTRDELGFDKVKQRVVHVEDDSSYTAM